jgi:hypothetical protein
MNVLFRVMVGTQIIQFVIRVSTLKLYGGLDSYIKAKNLNVVAIQHGV